MQNIHDSALDSGLPCSIPNNCRCLTMRSSQPIHSPPTPLVQDLLTPPIPPNVSNTIPTTPLKNTPFPAAMYNFSRFLSISARAIHPPEQSPLKPYPTIPPRNAGPSVRESSAALASLCGGYYKETNSRVVSFVEYLTSEALQRASPCEGRRCRRSVPPSPHRVLYPRARTTTPSSPSSTARRTQTGTI
ncbi:hypothetical protein BDW69DRAFT_153696 [Aspergillus filifer]